MTKTENICCPTCNKKGTWNTQNPDRPFCSPRCKLIDLGAWADEQHRIPGESSPSSEDNNSESEK